MIESLKDLEKLFKLCRKQGITELELGAVKFKMGDMPHDMSQMGQNNDISEDPYKNFPQGELSPEQLMFYSAGGVPEEDPALKVG